MPEGSSVETDELRPRNPYSASKAGADRLAYSYWATHDVPVIITRASNNYGPNQFPEKVIPLFITNAMENLPVPLYGDGQNVRDWLHVEDHCRGVDMLLAKGVPGQVYNIGGGNEVKNVDLTRRILEILGKPASLIQPVEDRKGHDRRYSLSTEKLRTMGWAPIHDFAEGLRETVKWYRTERVVVAPDQGTGSALPRVLRHAVRLACQSLNGDRERPDRFAVSTHASPNHVREPRGPILVTGAAGFAGSHLLDLIKHDGQPIAGWHLYGHHPLDRLRPHRARRSRAWTGTAVDLTDRDAVQRGDRGRSGPRRSITSRAPRIRAIPGMRTDESLRANALGTHHLLDALRRERIDARVLVIGSAAVYHPKQEPFGEESPIGPTSPYGVSKLAQEMTALQSFALHRQHVIVARSFNHIGPRQSADYVASSFARQIAMIEAGQAPPVILVGNLEARRDLMDVRDTVRAYRALMRRGEPGRAYNVCSGEAHAIRELLDGLLAHSTVNVEVRVDASRLRPVDQPLLVGRLDRIRRETGWQPEIDWSRTLADLLQDWRTRIAA